MVPSVFEDLKRRWNKNNILAATEGAVFLPLLETEEDDFPWAAVTAMIPGEADSECARTSKLTGSAVLTNDSDLLLHDLGSHGSVLLLNSVELSEWNSLRPIESNIKAKRLSPKLLACRLGINNIHHFAYELRKNPRLGLSELIRRSKNDQNSLEATPDYREFVEEYNCVSNAQPVMIQLPQHIDPRISELLFQLFQLRGVHLPGFVPHMYLAILNEDHSRRCAWEDGHLYRVLGYSVFNLSFPATGRCEFVDEHVRRGGRIAINRITLGDEEWITAEVRALGERLNSMGTVFDGDVSSPCFWTLFAISDIYGLETRTAVLKVEQLCRFLSLGYMGKKLEWEDIHLHARINAVLYSMRILSQALEVMPLTEGPMLKTKSILAALPPLHVMMRSRREMTMEVSSDIMNKVSRDFLCFFDQHNQASQTVQPSHVGQDSTILHDQGKNGDTRRETNPYEFLSLE